jgi:aspartyl-tRNA(Asn)/glutamyl-tRNA(Gln) amidotransferase subunit B
VTGEVLREINARKIGIKEFTVPPEHVAALIALVDEGTISNTIAKEVFVEMAQTKKSPHEIVKERGLEQISDADALSKSIADVLEGLPKEVERYRSGETKLLGFFVGRVMRATKGKANPQVVNEILRDLLR